MVSEWYVTHPAGVSAVSECNFTHPGPRFGVIISYDFVRSTFDGIYKCVCVCERERERDICVWGEYASKVVWHICKTSCGILKKKVILTWNDRLW